METALLGRSGLRVSRLSFGASALGGVFRAIDEAEGIRAVHAALDAGITYFDVAPAYGGTRAETVLGRALAGVPRDRYVLSTKAGKYTQPGTYGVDELDYSEARIRTGLAASMKRLGVDHVDIVHLHDFEYQGGSRTEEAFRTGFPALVRLREEGLIGAVGAGIYPLDLWRRVIREAPVDVVLTHNHYCLNDTTGTALLPECSRRGIGAINASPFASGLLTGRPAPDWHPADPAARTLFARAARFCEEQGSSLAKLAFQFAASESPFATTLFSTASARSVARNLAWLEEPLDRALLDTVQSMLEPVRDRQWDYDAGIKDLAR